MSGPPDLRKLPGVHIGPRVEPPGPLAPPPTLVKPDKPPKKQRTAMPKRSDHYDEKHAEQFSDCARMARLLPCCRCDRRPPSEAAHVLSRGAGGKDSGNVVPFCTACHRFQGDIGVPEFERRTGLSMESIAAEVQLKVAQHACDDFPDQAGRTCLVCESRIDTPRTP